MNSSPSGRVSRIAIGLAVAFLVLATGPGVALAAPVQGVAGTMVVQEGETVDSVQGVAGTVIIRGTVTGDVEVAAGSLVITGEVQGDVSGAAGSVDIRGRVGGDVELGAGSLIVADGAIIGGTLDAGTGSARIAGTIGDDATVGAGSIVLDETATIEGDFRYDGDLEDRGATVEGQLVRDRSIGGVRAEPIRGIGQAAFDVYGFLVNLVLGAVLLVVFPGGTRRLADRVQTEALETGVYGLVALIAVPVLLVLVAITIIGIPLAIIGAVLFALVAWAGSVLGRYAVGEWLLGYVDTDNRWAALLVGMVVIGLIGLVPILGGLVEFVVLLLGLGGLALAGRELFQARRGSSAA